MKLFIYMKFKLSLMSCILTGKPRFELCSHDRLSLAGGKGKKIALSKQGN